MSAPVEPHAIAPESFLDEVHSFEFWFGAVQGYLAGRPYGALADLEVPDLDEGERDALITTLCNYCIGETTALEGASGMIAFAPNSRAKIFLATQVADEARHLEVLLHRLSQLGVEDPEAEVKERGIHKMFDFRNRLLKFVYSRDWEAALFAQNVILECMEFSVFHAHAGRADPVTRDMLEGIIKDERRHVGFGENELGRQLKATPHMRDRLSHIRRELDPLVIGTFDEVMTEIQAPRDERPDLARAYLAAVSRLGFDG
ncbi:MAG: ferritin-like fold-containing protein [Myxococcota bacterium]